MRINDNEIFDYGSVVESKFVKFFFIVRAIKRHGTFEYITIQYGYDWKMFFQKWKIV